MKKKLCLILSVVIMTCILQACKTKDDENKQSTGTLKSNDVTVTSSVSTEDYDTDTNSYDETTIAENKPNSDITETTKAPKKTNGDTAKNSSSSQVNGTEQNNSQQGGTYSITNNDINTPTQITPFCKEVLLDKQFDDVLALDNGKLVTVNWENSKSKSIHYYATDLTNNSTHDIGQIDNVWSFSGDFILDSAVYFSAGMCDDSSALVKADINKKEVSILEKSILPCLFFNGVATKTDLLLQKRDRMDNDTQQVSSIDFYDTKTNSNHNIITKTATMSKDKCSNITFINGDVIYCISYYKDIVYSLECQYSDGRKNWGLVKYNLKGEEINRIDLNSISDLFQYSGFNEVRFNEVCVSEIRVINDYLFIGTMSNGSLICSIKNNILTAIYPKEYLNYNLVPAISKKYTEQRYLIFYESYESDELTILDTKNNKIINVKMDINLECDSINFIYADDKNNLFISLSNKDRHPGEKEYYYYANLDYFINNPK